VLAATLARHGASGGLMASLFSHNIGLPPIQRHGSAELQAEVIPGVLRGEKIAALAITEPGGGTDVSSLRTTAVRDGDEYVVNGEKIFITSGMRADWITAAVRTDPKMKGPDGCFDAGDSGPRCRGVAQPPGQDGLALLRHRAPALRQRSGAGPLPRWRRGSRLQDDHDQLQRRAPVDGRHVAGFFGTLLRRRAGLGAPAQDLRHGHHRSPGDPPQVDGHEDAHRVHPRLARCGDRARRQRRQVAKGAEWVAQVCLLKNHATQTMQFCADAAVQILGGMGFMQGTAAERIYREVKVMMIGGGTEEIMKELASRQLSL
jgi:acyl-CoA dehydrogenase